MKISELVQHAIRACELGEPQRAKMILEEQVKSKIEEIRDELRQVPAGIDHIIDQI